MAISFRLWTKQTIMAQEDMEVTCEKHSQVWTKRFRYESHQVQCFLMRRSHCLYSTHTHTHTHTQTRVVEDRSTLQWLCSLLCRATVPANMPGSIKWQNCHTSPRCRGVHTGGCPPLCHDMLPTKVLVTGFSLSSLLLLFTQTHCQVCGKGCLFFFTSEPFNCCQLTVFFS